MTAPGGMGIDDITVVSNSKVDQARDLCGRILKIIIHDHHVVSLRVVQARHDCIVLAEISGQSEIQDLLRKRFLERPANLIAIVITAIVHQYDLERVQTQKFDQSVHERANGGTAIINRNNNR
jgi:hypothetical protein